MAVSTILLLIFFVIFSIAYGINEIKCPCSGPLSNFVSISRCTIDDQCSLNFTENDFDRLVAKFLYGRRIARNDLKRHYEPICSSIDAWAHHGGEIGLVAYDPLKVFVSAKSEAASHPNWTKKHIGPTIVLRFCSLWDRRKRNFIRDVCELQGSKDFQAQTCWFRNLDEPSNSKNSKFTNFGHYLTANFMSFVMVLIGFAANK